MGKMFGTMEDYGDMFQDSFVQTRDASLSSTASIVDPVVYKLVRVARDGKLVPATDEEILEVKDLFEYDENVTVPGQTEGYIPDVGSPSQFLQLESLEDLFQSETAEAYTEKLNSRLESKEELMHGSQMFFSLPDTNYQGFNEMPVKEEQVQSEVLLQEPICFSANGCSMDHSRVMSPYSNDIGSPKALALSASEPEFSRVSSAEICLDNLSIRALQETFRAMFGRVTTVKDKQWLKRRIAMGPTISCAVPTTSPTINDDMLIGGGEDKYEDTVDAFINYTVDEGRDIHCKDAPASPDCVEKRHSNDFGRRPVETFVDHYSGNEDFKGEHRAVKRVRKPTKRYIEELSKIGEKQQSDESMIPSKEQRSVTAASSGGRVVVTRMVSLGGSRIQVPYVSHARRSRPRENIMALGEFNSSSWEIKSTPEESNLSLSSSKLKNNVSRVSGVKSAPGPVKKELAIDNQSDKKHSKPYISEVVEQDMMESDHIDSSGDISDDNNNNRVDLPIRQDAIRRKHHRAWSLSEVVKLVKGVSTYGVGKWSEIKKHSFPSHSHRTSVDLKDKWRNLLKASFAQKPSNRTGSIKHGSMAIPSEILKQVRELAQKKSFVSNASKAGRMVVKGSRNGVL